MKTLSLITVLLLNSWFCPGQPDTVQYAKSEQFKHEMSSFLTGKAEYPQKAVEFNTWGDVIISREIDTAGNFLQPIVVKSPSIYLSLSALETLENLSNKWDPADFPYLTFGRQYIFVFRYRIYMNVFLQDPKIRAVKLLNERKYDKALKIFDKAVEENQYDHDLYSLRAECKRNLGDNSGAEQDHAMAEKLRNEIMAVIDVVKLGVPQPTQTVTSGSRIVFIPVNR